MNPRPAPVFTVLVTLTAWFAISNHCALGTAVSVPKPQQDQCPFHAKHSAPEKQKNSSDSPCCKILRALAPQKAFVAKIFFARCIDFGTDITAPIPKIAGPVLQLDTGPPKTTSFVELIWSMRAHAPPQLA